MCNMGHLKCLIIIQVCLFIIASADKKPDKLTRHELPGTGNNVGSNSRKRQTIQDLDLLQRNRGDFTSRRRNSYRLLLDSEEDARPLNTLPRRRLIQRLLASRDRRLKLLPLVDRDYDSIEIGVQTLPRRYNRRRPLIRGRFSSSRRNNARFSSGRSRFLPRFQTSISLEDLDYEDDFSGYRQTNRRRNQHASNRENYRRPQTQPMLRDETENHVSQLLHNIDKSDEVDFRTSFEQKEPDNVDAKSIEDISVELTFAPRQRIPQHPPLLNVPATRIPTRQTFHVHSPSPTPTFQAPTKPRTIPTTAQAVLDSLILDDKSLEVGPTRATNLQTTLQPTQQDDGINIEIAPTIPGFQGETDFDSEEASAETTATVHTTYQAPTAAVFVQQPVTTTRITQTTGQHHLQVLDESSEDRLRPEHRQGDISLAAEHLRPEHRHVQQSLAEHLRPEHRHVQQSLAEHSRQEHGHVQQSLTEHLRPEHRHVQQSLNDNLRPEHRHVQQSLNNHLRPEHRHVQQPLGDHLRPEHRHIQDSLEDLLRPEHRHGQDSFEDHQDDSLEVGIAFGQDTIRHHNFDNSLEIELRPVHHSQRQQHNQHQLTTVSRDDHHILANTVHQPLPPQIEKNYRAQDYAYNYNVDNVETGDVKSHREFRENGVVIGQYSVLRPDGFLETTRYRADSNGYKVNVTKKFVGIFPPSPPPRKYADVQHSIVSHQIPSPVPAGPRPQVLAPLPQVGAPQPQAPAPLPQDPVLQPLVPVPLPQEPVHLPDTSLPPRTPPYYQTEENLLSLPPSGRPSRPSAPRPQLVRPREPASSDQDRASLGRGLTAEARVNTIDDSHSSRIDGTSLSRRYEDSRVTQSGQNVHTGRSRYYPSSLRVRPRSRYISRLYHFDDSLEFENDLSDVLYNTGGQRIRPRNFRRRRPNRPAYVFTGNGRRLGILRRGQSIEDDSLEDFLQDKHDNNYSRESLEHIDDSLEKIYSL